MLLVLLSLLATVNLNLQNHLRTNTLKIQPVIMVQLWGLVWCKTCLEHCTFYTFLLAVAGNSRLGFQYKEVQSGNDQEWAVQSGLAFSVGTKAPDRKDEEGIPY